MASFAASSGGDERPEFSYTSLDDFDFHDVPPAARWLYFDISETHGFKLRGPNYMEDNVKENVGKPLLKLLLVELYGVDEAKEKSDRHDHIALRARPQRRLNALHKVCPFVFMTNFQIPGTPPVSIVSYYAVPPEFAPMLGLKECPDLPTSKYGELPEDPAELNATIKA